MMQTHTLPSAEGSNQVTAQIFLSLIFGSVLLGGFLSLLGPGLRLIGTWQVQSGNTYAVFRFEDDGTYWHRNQSGSRQVEVLGTYKIIQASGATYRVQITTEAGEEEIDVQIEGSDRLVWIDPDKPDGRFPVTRTGDWVFASRPSPDPSSYDGAKPHLGCWRRPTLRTETLEFLEGGSVLHVSGDKTARSTYTVDYSKVPFQLDITRSDGTVEQAIFRFGVDGSLDLSGEGRTDGERANTASGFHNYTPCPAASAKDTQGDP